MRLFLILLPLSLALPLYSQTLDDYIRLGLDNNPGLRAKRTEHQAALQTIPQAGALPEPELNASVFAQPMMLPMGNQLGSISAMQMFPWFGTLEAMKTEAAQMAEVKRQSVKAAENELIYRIKTAWYPLLELEEQIRLERKNLRVLELDKELATTRFQQGKAPMVDAIQADIMIEEAQTTIALLEQKRQPLAAAFNRLINRETGVPIAISEALPEPGADNGLPLDSAFSGNPSLAVFDRQIQAAAAEQAVADRMRKPMFGAGLQYMPLVKRNGDELPPNTGRDMVMPMFRVTLPIWRKKYDAAVEERRLMQLMYGEMKEDMRNELHSMYEMSRYELEEAAQMAALLERQINKTQQAVDLLLAAYSQAGQDFEEVLNLQRQLFRYASRRVSAQANYQLALARLAYLSGANTYTSN